MHARTMDVFERQNATYERVHFDLVALNKGSDKVHGSLDDDSVDRPQALNTFGQQAPPSHAPSGARGASSHFPPTGETR